MNKQAKVYQRLDELKIKYEVSEHQAVFTIEEFDELKYGKYGHTVKNLFLRDAKGKRHFLVVMDKDKKVNLKELREQLQCSALSFASEIRLEKYLDLTKGSVTPLGIINDTDSCVEVIFDKDLTGDVILGVHPNINTATVWISFDDVKTVIEKNGNTIKYVLI